MRRNPQIIAHEIMTLVAELAESAGVTTPKLEPLRATGSQRSTKAGPMAGIRLLLEEGKLDSPKDRAEVAELLKQEGWHYSKRVIGVALMRLVRERALTRLKDASAENWKYVQRK